MKKKISFIIGTAVFLMVMAVNIQYAFNGYGISKNSLHMEVLAQTSSGSTTLPEVVITCETGGSGQCWYLDWHWCEEGDFFHYDCYYSGYQSNSCSGFLKTICQKITI